MSTFATGAGDCGEAAPFGEPQIDPRTVYPIAVGDAISLPLTWWQVQPVYGSDGVTVVTPGVPMNMAGMTPFAEFLTYGQSPFGGTPLAILLFDPATATWTVTGPGHGQPGDLTSGLRRLPVNVQGPQIRNGYTDAAGQHTLGTYYLAVR